MRNRNQRRKYRLRIQLRSCCARLLPRRTGERCVSCLPPPPARGRSGGVRGLQTIGDVLLWCARRAAEDAPDETRQNSGGREAQPSERVLCARDAEGSWALLCAADRRTAGLPASARYL